MKERGPSEYQPKHQKQISIDGYRGVASDLMKLNVPVADGFMRVSDMRYHVVVTQKPHERALDYDQLGTVRVAKMLDLPRLEFWRKKGNFFTKRENDTWFVAIDDQALAQEVSNNNIGNRFDDAFVERFRETLIGGLKSCLKKEKLLNAGEYNRAFSVSYGLGVMWDAHMLALAGVLAAVSDQPINTVGSVIAIDALGHTLFNPMNMLQAAMGKLPSGGDPPFSERRSGILQIANWPKFHEPFIRHSIFDLPMPMVPVDRLRRKTNSIRIGYKESDLI